MNRSAPVSSLPYVVSFAALAAAVLVRWLLDPVVGDTIPFITLFAAIGVAVWIGGYRPALLVAGLGYAACHYLFIQPRGRFDLSEPRNIVGLLLYLATASLIIVLGEAHRRAQQRYQQGEEAARRQAELMRTTLASIGDGVITTDPEGKITSMNAVAEGLTGWTKAEVAGVPLTQVFRVIHELTRLEVENPVIRALKDEVIVGLANPTLLIAKDGSEMQIDDSAAPIRSEQGEVIGCVLVFRDISARRRAEIEQRTVQEQIAKTLESVTDGFMRYDRDWRIVYVNAEAERINRLTRSEMLGRILWEVFPALAGTKFETEFRRAVAERVTIEFENYYEPFGRWYALKGYPSDEGGLTTFIRDITEQKVSREALERSEARLRRVFESNVVGMIQWNLDLSLILDANETFLRMTGYTRDDVAAGRLNFRDMTPPEWTQRNEEGIQTIRADGHAAPYEKEYFRKDGTRVPLIIAGTRFDDSPTEGMSLLIDISDRKRAEQEIVRLAAESDRQRRLYETVLTNTPDFVYVFSLDHKVVYANDALIKMWGRGYEGAIGKTFLEIGYEPWHAEMHDREIDQVRATRQPIRGEVPFNGTHGVRQYDYIFVPVIGADGEVEAVAGTTRDVTERKQTEDQLRRNHDTFFELIQNNPFGVYVVDADFRLRQVSLGAQKVFETIRPLVGGDFAEVLRSLWPEPFASQAIARFRHTLDTGEPYSAPSTIERRADIGVVESYDWRIERISMPDGQYGVVCYFYDLTERQKWEATLLASEERLRLATQAAELGIWTWQPDGDIVVWENERPYEIFGMSRTEPPLTAARFKAEFLQPEDLDTFEKSFGRTLQIKAPLLCECRIRRMDGQLRWIEFTGRAVDGEENVRLIGTVQDITDRREAEKALRESEARHRFAVTVADTIRPLADPVDVRAEASRVLGERLGANRVLYFEVQGEDYVVERDYTDAAPSMVGRYPIASFGPELLAVYRDGRTVAEADVDALSSLTMGEKEAFAAVQIRSYIGVPLVKDGVFVAGFGVHASTVREWTPTEIALTEETAERTWAAVERAKAEAALRASEESRRLALDAAELGTFNIDPTSNTLTTDERFRIIFAGSTAAMDYEQAFAAIHPDDQERIRGAVAAATRLEDPAAYAQEYRVVHPDKSVHWVLAKGRANFAGQGLQRRIVSFDGTVSDITAQKESEMRMRESEERFRLMADAAPVMIWMSGRDKLFNWYNQPWLDFTGRTMAEEVGGGATEVIHPDDLVRTQPIYTAAFDARTPFSMEYRLRRHDGEFRWMICNGVPRCRADGEFEGYIGSCFDVTDYKNAQAALLDADRRKDEFLATLAHELRNPLAPIHNGLQILQAEGVSGTVEQARAMMERQLTQLIRLVDDLLDVSRVTSGKLALRKERVELRAIIDAAIETSRPVIDQAGHELAVVVPDEPILVDADATRLAQVVANLLNNSAKYTRRGGHIRLAVRMEKGMAVVGVADDGIGIPPHMVGKVFEMFTQVDRALEKTTGGLGIGLSLVKGLVEMHGGTIEARSEGEGRGSEFIMRLPVAVAVTQKAEPAVVAPQAGSSRRRRILVADDNVDSARSLGRLLELNGNDVRTAHDGLQAVKAAEAFQPEVILLDIGMPELNGHEVCRRIRELPWGRNATLVAMTGWGQEEDKRQSHEAGFDLHLVKPVDFVAIKKLLSSLKTEKVGAAVPSPPTSE